MNEFWELHRKMLIVLGVAILVALLSWFAFGRSLYASMRSKEVNAKMSHKGPEKYYEVGVPIEHAKEVFNKQVEMTREEIEALKNSLEMKFDEYVEIPKEQQRTKMTYFDQMLYEARENLSRLAAVTRVKIPPTLGWPDFVDIPAEKHDEEVPKLLKKLSVTDRLVKILLYSRVGRERVLEISRIDVGEIEVSGPGEGYPNFVRQYPITVEFTTTINPLLRFLSLVHYVDLTGRKRKTGQFFEVKGLDVRWNDNNPNKKLKVTATLYALEFLDESELENRPQKPQKTTKPGEAIGY